MTVGTVAECVVTVIEAPATVRLAAVVTECVLIAAVDSSSVRVTATLAETVMMVPSTECEVWL